MSDLLWCLRHDGIAQVAATIAVLCSATFVWMALAGRRN
jgi:hypothetical protein